MGNKHPVTLTRLELYQQVWKTPMVKLVAKYGDAVAWGRVRRGSSPRGKDYDYREGTYLQLQEESIDYDFGEIHQHIEMPITGEERSR